MTSIFTALLDVMKQELAADRPARPDHRPDASGIARLAVVGTGLVGASVALAARRARVRCAGFDIDARALATATGLGAVESADSLEAAVAGADLVVVAVPVGAAAAVVRDVLAASGPETTVTDVASTKRRVAAIDDQRFVPGHPVAGGDTGGPRRAGADLFEGATWFVPPTPATGAERLERVERFVTALGARSVRADEDAHDRPLALTSHLPHVVANLLTLRVAAATRATTPARPRRRVAARDDPRRRREPGVWTDTSSRTPTRSPTPSTRTAAAPTSSSTPSAGGDRARSSHDRGGGRGTQPDARPSPTRPRPPS